MGKPGPRVLLLGTADWAGSCNAVCRAVNRVGRVECRQVSFYEHPYGYPADIVIPVKNEPDRRKASDYPAEYDETMALLERADLIHLWNDMPQAFRDLVPLPLHKVRSCTFTGTLYRRNHTRLNRTLKDRKMKVVVQNPTYRYPEEYDATFIPHAVDTDRLEPLAPEEREERAMGCYRPVHANTSAREDIDLLESALREDHPGWRITLDQVLPWEERMTRMARCTHFFEYMDPQMGYWGRSALEACALGIPTFSYVSPKALRMADGRFGQPAILPVDRHSLRDVLARYLNLPTDAYAALSRRSRAWVETFYGFEPVGRLYTDFFRRVLEAGPGRGP